MEQLKAYAIMERYKDYLFPNNDYTEDEVQEALLAAPDSFADNLARFPFKNPSTVQLIAVFPGVLGVDRFYLGEKGKAILKFFTFGGFGIWWIVDILSAKKRCSRYNCKLLMDAITDSFVTERAFASNQKEQITLDKVKAAAPVVKDLLKTVGSSAKKVGSTFDVTNQKW